MGLQAERSWCRGWGRAGGWAPLHSPELTPHGPTPPCSSPLPGGPGGKEPSALLTAGHIVGTQDRVVLPLSGARVS